MTTSSMSYLQTLAKDEAIAFVTSLQKVKAHLSQELQWVSEQVQQKTAQLQSIETLLSEAEALGLVTADTHPILGAASAIAAPSAPGVTTTGAPHESGLELPATENESTSPVATTEAVAVEIAALPSKKPSKPSRGQHEKVDPAKMLSGSKPLATNKTSTARAKQPKPSTPTASKAHQRGKASNLQQFLKRSFRDQALTEAVSNILNRAAVPLNTDEVMVALYDELPKADYDRAKHSLANILSVGKSKGAWKSTGRGHYASNAVTTA